MYQVLEKHEKISRSIKVWRIHWIKQIDQRTDAASKLQHKLLFAAVLRIAENYLFHGSNLLIAVMETQV